MPEFIDQRFRENKPKTLIYSHRKRAFRACFRENRDYNFRHGAASIRGADTQHWEEGILQDSSSKRKISLFRWLWLVCGYCRCRYSTVLTELWARGPLLDPLFGQGQVGARACAPKQQAVFQISTRTRTDLTCVSTSGTIPKRREKMKIHVWRALSKNMALFEKKMISNREFFCFFLIWIGAGFCKLPWIRIGSGFSKAWIPVRFSEMPGSRSVFSKSGS